MKNAIHHARSGLLLALGLACFATTAQAAVGYLLTDLGALPTHPRSGGQNLNDLGEVAVTIYNAGSQTKVFRYSSGTLTDLGTLGGALSAGLRINQAGDVAGYSQITGSANYRPFVYSFADGLMTDLGTFGGNNGYAIDLNDVGWVTGDAEIAGGARRAFLYDRVSSGMTDLGTLIGKTHSTGQGINNAGVVVGYAFNTPNFDDQPFVYRSGESVNLNDLIEPTAGWVLTRANAINGAGQITGSATFNGVARGFLLTPVPEASTSATLLAGLLMVGTLTLRRKRG